MRQPQWLNFPLSRYISLLAKYLKSLRFQVYSLALLLFASTGLQLLIPYTIRYFTDITEADGALRDLLIAAGSFISISLLYQGISWVQRYLAETIAWLMKGGYHALRVE
jgi:hypothetical protein